MDWPKLTLSHSPTNIAELCQQIIKDPWHPPAIIIPQIHITRTQKVMSDPSTLLTTCFNCYPLRGATDRERKTAPSHKNSKVTVSDIVLSIYCPKCVEMSRLTTVVLDVMFQMLQ